MRTLLVCLYAAPIRCSRSSGVWRERGGVSFCQIPRAGCACVKAGSGEHEGVHTMRVAIFTAPLFL